MIREWEKTEALMTEDLPENRSTVPGSTSTVGQAVFSHAKPSSEGNPVSRHVQLKLDGESTYKGRESGRTYQRVLYRNARRSWRRKNSERDTSPHSFRSPPN